MVEVQNLVVLVVVELNNHEPALLGFGRNLSPLFAHEGIVKDHKV